MRGGDNTSKSETQQKLSIRTLSFRPFMGRKPKKPRPSVFGILEQGDKAATVQAEVTL